MYCALRKVYLLNHFNFSHPSLEVVVYVFVIERMPVIDSLKCTVPFSFVVPLLSLTVTHCYLLSLVVIRCITRCHSLSLVVSLVVTRCHSLSFVVTRCTTGCHSLYQSLSLVVTRCTTRCHSLSFVVTHCHPLSFVVTRCKTRLSFYK